MNTPKVLCLMTCGRAGSKFFHSLLDNHPQIMCFPRTMRFNNFWASAHRKDNAEYLVDLFIARHPRFFTGKIWARYAKYDKADQLGVKKNETFLIDINAFRQNALTELNNKNLSRTTLFIALHRAYHITCGREVPENPLILYHIHRIDEIEELRACLTDFPNNTYLIVSARHPIEEMNSIITWKNLHNDLNCGSIFHHQKQIIRGVTHITDNFPKLNIRVLPFEKTQRQQREVMETLVDWLGIRWHDNLMISTMHGKLWWGNAKIPHNKANLKWQTYRPSGILEKKDWKVIRNLVFNRMKRYGYIGHTEKRKISAKPKFLALLMLPTKPEWALLKYIFSVNYWREALRAQKISKKLIRYIFLFNPLKWFYFYIARIVYCYRFFEKTNKQNEKVPSIL